MPPKYPSSLWIGCWVVCKELTNCHRKVYPDFVVVRYLVKVKGVICVSRLAHDRLAVFICLAKKGKQEWYYFWNGWA
ncbi:MAG: hypothetical protein GX364_02025 [Firmicutes bacterium]|nr:hypothetical protein [Bacillota bacterium]